jgi:hypothetical protein
LVVKEEVFTLVHHDADEVALLSNVDLGSLSTKTGVFCKAAPTKHSARIWSMQQFQLLEKHHHQLVATQTLDLALFVASC